MSTVATPIAAVAAQSEDRALVRALMGGTRAMRAAGQRYMPIWPAEDNESYKSRLGQAVLFPAYSRTVETLASKPFSQPLTLGDDVPPVIVEWAEDIDLQGRNLHAFCRDTFAHALGAGIAGILVDYPRAEGVRTLADERNAGARPYFIQIEAEQILGWRASRASGKWRIDQLRIMETVDEPDGEFGTETVKQVRVLTPGAWATYRETKDGWAPYEAGETSLPAVPFVPVYGKRTGFMLGEPPLMQVAFLNAKHWSESSDQDKSVRFARVRIAAIVGGDVEDKITVGSDYFLRLPVGASIEIAQGSAEAVGIGRSELNVLEEQMRQSGAELLVIKPGAITATQVATENAVGMSALQSMAAQAEDAFDAALQIMADWVRLPQGGHVSLFDDYGAQTLAEASAELLFKMNQAGKLSDITTLDEMKRRGVLAAEVDSVTEKERIAEQGPALGMLVDSPPKPPVPPHSEDGSTDDPPAA